MDPLYPHEWSSIVVSQAHIRGIHIRPVSCYHTFLTFRAYIYQSCHISLQAWPHEVLDDCWANHISSWVLDYFTIPIYNNNYDTIYNKIMYLRFGSIFPLLEKYVQMCTFTMLYLCNIISWNCITWEKL